MSTISDRIIQRMSELKLRQVDLIEATGATKGAVSKWVSGRNIPKSEFMPALAEVLKTSQKWLLTGKEQTKFNNFNILEFMAKHGLEKSNALLTDMEIEIYNDDDPVPEGYEAVDYYPEVKASAGIGYVNIEEHSPYKIFIPKLEFREFGADPKTSKIFEVDGESMVPDLYPGQRFSVDTSAKKIYDGEIYAFLKGDELKVKMLFEWNDEGEGGFKAVSRNPDKVRYPDEYYSPARIEAEFIQILGQYWWKMEGRKVRR